jgi:hypothetical protein
MTLSFISFSDLHLFIFIHAQGCRRRVDDGRDGGKVKDMNETYPSLLPFTVTCNQSVFWKIILCSEGNMLSFTCNYTDFVYVRSESERYEGYFYKKPFRRG